MSDAIINDDEFGRCFEVGMSDHAKGLKMNRRRYKNEYRQLAYKDGWEASVAEESRHE